MCKNVCKIHAGTVWKLHQVHCADLYVLVLRSICHFVSLKWIAWTLCLYVHVHVHVPVSIEFPWIELICHTMCMYVYMYQTCQVNCIFKWWQIHMYIYVTYRNLCTRILSVTTCIRSRPRQYDDDDNDSSGSHEQQQQ